LKGQITKNRSAKIQPNKFFGMHCQSHGIAFNRKILSWEFCFFCGQKKKAGLAKT